MTHDRTRGLGQEASDNSPVGSGRRPGPTRPARFGPRPVNRPPIITNVLGLSSSCGFDVFFYVPPGTDEVSVLVFAVSEDGVQCTDRRPAA